MPDRDAVPSTLETKPRRRGFRRLLPVALLVAVLFGGVSGATVSFVLEENDEFCIACHTAPEQVYFDRARQAEAGDAPLDLSSVHMSTHEREFNCIACHHGSGNLGDRITSLALGLKDTAVLIAGRADPTVEKRTAAAPGLIDRGCVACHVDTIVVAGFENHFHVKLPSAWSVIQSGVKPVVPPDTLPGAPDPLTDPQGKPEPLETTVNCLSCHVAHLSGFEFVNYLDESGAVFPACNTCHMETERGPIGLAP